jgi:hypothetical protein
VVAAGRGRLDPPGPGAVDHGDGFPQVGADVVQADSVLGGVSSREPALGHAHPEDATAGLVTEVVVDPVAVGQEAQAITEEV